jgi:hypothetical protein
MTPEKEFDEFRWDGAEARHRVAAPWPATTGASLGVVRLRIADVREFTLARAALHVFRLSSCGHVHQHSLCAFLCAIFLMLLATVDADVMIEFSVHLLP